MSKATNIDGQVTQSSGSLQVAAGWRGGGTLAQPLATAELKLRPPHAQVEEDKRSHAAFCWSQQIISQFFFFSLFSSHWCTVGGDLPDLEIYIRRSLVIQLGPPTNSTHTPPPTNKQSNKKKEKTVEWMMPREWSNICTTNTDLKLKNALARCGGVVSVTSSIRRSGGRR